MLRSDTSCLGPALGAPGSRTIVASIFLPEFFPEFRVCFVGGCLAQLASDDIVVPGVGYVVGYLRCGGRRSSLGGVLGGHAARFIGDSLLALTRITWHSLCGITHLVTRTRQGSRKGAAARTLIGTGLDHFALGENLAIEIFEGFIQLTVAATATRNATAATRNAGSLAACWLGGFSVACPGW